jgi:hypothetical protein
VISLVPHRLTGGYGKEPHELTIRAGNGLIGIYVQKNCLVLGDRGQIDAHAKQEDRDCA